MTNRLARKRRLARALAHQKKTRHGNVADTERLAGADVSPTVDFVEKELGTPTTTLQRRLLEEFAPLAVELIEHNPLSTHATGSAVDVNVDPPNRAKCPHCGKSQKVRKDGTFGKHAYTATDTSTCSGTDARWDVVAP